MVYVGIDISVNSTAVSVYDKDYKFYNYTTKKSNYVWIKKTSDIIDYRFFTFGYKEIDDFSDKLVSKVKDYDSYSDLIINDIKSHGDKFVIGIEGYNYGLKTTDSIIDISELSSIIKMKLVKNFPDSHIIIMPPKTVKIKSCKMVYKLLDGQKVVRNDKGVAGGSFDKHDMMTALIDSNIENKVKDFLIENKDTILNMKSIPKPWDDIIDAQFIMEIIKMDFDL